MSSKMKLIQGACVLLLLLIKLSAVEAMDTESALASQCRFFPFHPSCRGHMSKRVDPSMGGTDYYSVDQFQYTQGHPKPKSDSKTKLISLLKMILNDRFGNIDSRQSGQVFTGKSNVQSEQKQSSFPTFKKDRSSLVGKNLLNLLQNYRDDGFEEPITAKNLWNSNQ